VPWQDIKQAVKGRETDILDRLGIPWRNGRPHINCPFHDHPDSNPSYRWDVDKARFFCSFSSGSIFDVVSKIEGLRDFDDVKLRAAELIGREDLIVDPSARAGLTLEEYSAAKKLPIDFLLRIGVRQDSYKKLPAIRIPFFNEHGQPQTVQFRTSMRCKEDKYLKKGTKVCLYGANSASQLKNVGWAVIVDGPSDTQTLWYHNVPTFGLPGAGSWNETRDAHLFDGVPTIFVVVEPDKGGEATIKWLLKVYRAAGQAHPPAGWH
jgi:hypothetical protein